MNSQQVTRQGVFETNSSSSHSLSLGKATFITLPDLPEDVVASGVIRVHLCEYNDTGESLSTFPEKLAYLIAEIIPNWGFTELAPEQTEGAATIALCEQYPDLNTIQDFLNETLGISFVVLPGDSYIDGGIKGNVRNQVFSEPGILANYLFNPQTYVHLDHD
jgi:hypothetical protein